jgi:ABC-type multidrug transport system fused ATPase/permease subunit
VLVLDDATAAVDATKEHEIRTALATVMAGRTTLVIAHRPATIALADRVAVLENGRVVDDGTHGDLLSRSARYRSLLASTIPRRPAVERAPAKAVWRHTRVLVRPVRRHYLGAAVAVVVATLITLAGRRMPSMPASRSTTAHRSTSPRSHFSPSRWRSRSSCACRSFSRRRPASGFSAPSAPRAFDKLQALPLGFFEQERAGVLVSRLTSDVQALTEFVREALVEVAGSALQIVLTVTALLVLSPPLAAISLVALPILVVARWSFHHGAGRAYSAVNVRLFPVSRASRAIDTRVCGSRGEAELQPPARRRLCPGRRARRAEVASVCSAAEGEAATCALRDRLRHPIDPAVDAHV